MPSTTDSDKVVDLSQYRASRAAQAVLRSPQKSYVLWYPGVGAILSDAVTNATPNHSSRQARVPEDAS